MKRVIIVSLWGNVGDWKKTKYYIDYNEIKCSSTEKVNVGKPTKSTTALLYEVYRQICGEENVKPVIILPYSLILNDEKFRKELEKVNSLELSSKDLEKGLKQWIEEQAKKDYDDLLLNNLINNAEFIYIVGPLTYYKTSNKSFNMLEQLDEQKITSAESKILFRKSEKILNVIETMIIKGLYEILMKSNSNKYSEIEVVVDVTHGLNFYIPSFINGVKIATSLLAVNKIIRKEEIKKISISIYGSSPVSKEPIVSSENISASIYNLADIIIAKKEDDVMENLSFSLLQSEIMNELLTSTNYKALIKKYRTISYFSIGVIPWAIYYSKRSSNKELFDKNIDIQFKIKKKNNDIFISYKTKISENNIEKALILEILLSKILNEIETEDDGQWLCCTFDTLNFLAENILVTPYTDLLKDQLNMDEIDKFFEKVNEKTYQNKNDRLKEEVMLDPFHWDEFKRNFIAHAGLSKDNVGIVKIYLKDKKVCLNKKLE
ncbi:CRISPR-associated DxTHG motif protein [Saccharolobus caldissimus]|uniref:CRISPR-associated protein n=1 Tax=Saccharolobus caldissimus TaxID=1702097 RepID=A0AAQ4CSB3_9CREN|nr:TM1812 family CRISPR-associated protein [Saccharolobus caldissimus]BDB98694.1 CRISPR-associated protein [Saccharolobus caldissimus]